MHDRQDRLTNGHAESHCRTNRHVQPTGVYIGRFMDIILPDRDFTQIIARIMAGSFIMIAWDIDHAGAVTRFSQQLLNDVTMFLWPLEALL